MSRCWLPNEREATYAPSNILAKTLVELIPTNLVKEHANQDAFLQALGVTILRQPKKNQSISPKIYK